VLLNKEADRKFSHSPIIECITASAASFQELMHTRHVDLFWHVLYVSWIYL